MRETFPFYSPNLDRTVGPEYRQDMDQVVNLLRDPTLEEQIDQGNVTLALIRPQVGPAANLLGLSDKEASDHLEEMIIDLGIMAKFSFTFNHGTVETFYENARERMQENAPGDTDRYHSRWDEFRALMVSGPTTVLILYSPNGDAVEKWRANLGHWNIDNNRDPTTIRGQFGVNKFNNLAHGSDSPDSVRHELAIITALLIDETNQD